MLEDFNKLISNIKASLYHRGIEFNKHSAGALQENVKLAGKF